MDWMLMHIRARKAGIYTFAKPTCWPKRKVGLRNTANFDKMVPSVSGGAATRRLHSTRFHWLGPSVERLPKQHPNIQWLPPSRSQILVLRPFLHFEQRVPQPWNKGQAGSSRTSPTDAIPPEPTIHEGLFGRPISQVTARETPRTRSL